MAVIRFGAVKEKGFQWIFCLFFFFDFVGPNCRFRYCYGLQPFPVSINVRLEIYYVG